ncbi:UDP-glucuronosyltransferase 2A3-like isoform X2 [Cyclopterus lumpus]|uniref:UDP-glucuronosyltransferase 2A3-like isoform X2 n=1 Tax=Cyclopterus lumpus TaxID=8103 RepID=UPI001486937C|nr:UDP-glucuronosyltransferase 2A3-like isoform X2 [Cyclopterus lumpus]
MKVPPSSLITFAVLLIQLSGASGGKILVFPLDGSHWINMKVLIEELHAKGHEVTVVRLSDSWYISEKSPLYTSVTIPSPGGFEQNYFEAFLFRQLEIRLQGRHASSWYKLWSHIQIELLVVQQFSLLHKAMSEVVVQMFEDENLMQSFHEAKYDVVLTDPAVGVGAMLARRLRVPLVFNVRWTIQDIWLMRNDFVFEFPRPTMPNIIYMGGFQCKPPQPLPADLEEFVQSSGDHGVIMMTLGTLLGKLPQDVAEEIAAVFAQLPQKVVWRYMGQRLANLGNNTLLVNWLPQKDLLGHPKTRVFVTHGGTNGVQEAIYHGVPVVGLPLFFDQPDNLSRIRAKGGAVIVDIAELDRHIFADALKTAIYNSSYKENMQRLSRLSRDQPVKPLDQAVFWIEYVIRHKGARHLQTQSTKMSWFVYNCVDVIAALMAVVLLVTFTCISIVRLLWRIILVGKKVKHE